MAVATRFLALAPRVMALGRGGLMALGHRRLLAVGPRSVLALELATPGASGAHDRMTRAAAGGEADHDEGRA